MNAGPYGPRAFARDVAALAGLEVSDDWSEALAWVRSLASARDALAGVLGQVIMAASLAPGEEFLAPPEHEAVRAVLRLTTRVRVAERALALCAEFGRGETIELAENSRLRRDLDQMTRQAHALSADLIAARVELEELRGREARICDAAFDAAPLDIDHELRSHADTVPDWFRTMGAALETIKLIVSEAVKEHEPPAAPVEGGGVG